MFDKKIYFYLLYGLHLLRTIRRVKAIGDTLDRNNCH